MRHAAAHLAILAVALIVVSCTKDNPVIVTSSPTVALVTLKVSPISATLRITADSSSVADSDRFILLRGSSATTLTDTVFSGRSSTASFSLLDSNKGHWLTPGGGYYYQCVEIRDSTEYARSAAVAAVLTPGDLLPFVIGSVWVYKGYVTDTITGGKKANSDFISTDSLIGTVSYQGYDDAYMMQHAVYFQNTISFDTLYLRNVAGDLWEYSRYGFFPDRRTWTNKWRFATGVGVYTVLDTTDSISQPMYTIELHEVASCSISTPAQITVPYGDFSARRGVLNLAMDASVFGTVQAHDTIPGGTNYFSPGFGIVKSVRQSYIPKGTAAGKLPKLEGTVEELIAIRIKY